MLVYVVVKLKKNVIYKTELGNMRKFDTVNANPNMKLKIDSSSLLKK